MNTSCNNYFFYLFQLSSTVRTVRIRSPSSTVTCQLSLAQQGVLEVLNSIVSDWMAGRLAGFESLG
jgi:hypothetical protein